MKRGKSYVSSVPQLPAGLRRHLVAAQQGRRKLSGAEEVQADELLAAARLELRRRREKHEAETGEVIEVEPVILVVPGREAANHNASQQSS